MEDLHKTYSNNEITIVWKPAACIHSTRCWKGEQGLSSVFNPKEKPWIKPHGASTEQIIERVKACPSGALSYYRHDAENAKPDPVSQNAVVEVLIDGPLLVHGPIHLKQEGEGQELQNTVTAFCRCGASSNKPYCDGSHRHNGFKG